MSFQIAAFASDGIMLATESRANFYNRGSNDTTPLAFYDETPKIFIVKNIAFSSTGSGIVGDYTLKFIFEEFEKSLNSNILIASALTTFFNFCKSRLPTEFLKTLLNNEIYAITYENKTPFITYYKNGQIIFSENDFIYSDDCEFSKFYNKNLTCSELGDIAENAIYEYAISKDMTNTIGGNVSVLKVTNNGFEWVKNKPIYKWNTVNEIIQSCKKEEIKLNFTSLENENILKSLFQEY